MLILLILKWTTLRLVNMHNIRVIAHKVKQT